MAVVFPFIVSAGLYWLPNIGRLHDNELRAWSGLFIGIWFLPAATVSVVLTVVISSYWRGRKEGRGLRGHNS